MQQDYVFEMTCEGVSRADDMGAVVIPHKAELRFGNHRIVASAGVQQRDPLGPLLFSLVIMELVDEVGTIPRIELSL